MFEQLNKEKQMYEKQAKLGFIVTGISFVLFIPLSMASFLLIGFGGAIVPFLIMFPFMGGAIYGGYQMNKVKKMSDTFKNRFLEVELKKIIPDGTYRKDGGFTEQTLVRGGILRNRDRFYSEDLIIGTINGVDFKSSDVKQQDVSTNSKGHSSTTTVFLGRCYQFDFPKQFRDNVLITQPSIFEGIFKSYRKVEMESIEFNSELSVYSENHHEAFYILTPHLMERILYLDMIYRNKIKFSFKNEQLFIAINNGINTFDFKAFKPVDRSIFDEYQKEFKEITAFIKILMLDNTIFK